MTISIEQFWELAERARLFDHVETQTLCKRFLLSQKDTESQTAKAAAEWLLSQRRITGYQARSLLKGRAGPFVIGEYLLLQERKLDCAQLQRFDAIHESTRHRVLVTVWSDSAAWATIERRFHAGRRIRNANLDRWYECGDDDGRRFSVSEWPPGKTARQILETRQKIGATKACHLLHQISQALGHLHARGETHGAIRPDEIVVQDSGHAKLLRPVWPTNDLGSRIVNSESVRAGRLVHYAAPELVQPNAAADTLTDVYALGCTLYEMLTGTLPFLAADPRSMLEAHATQPLPPWDESLALPDGLSEVVSFMMAKRRSVRYQDMDEVVEKLERYLPSGIQQPKIEQRPTATLYQGHIDNTHRQAALPAHLASADVAQSDASDPQTVSVPSELVQLADQRPVEARRSMPRRGLPRWIYITTVVGTIGAAILLANRLLPRHAPTPEAAQRHPATTEGLQAPITPPQRDSRGEDLPGTKVGRQVETEIGVPDDGRMLWLAPKSGGPIDLRYTPSGTQCLLFLRPAKFLKHSLGDETIRALGPAVQSARRNLASEFGISLSHVDQLLLCFSSQNSSEPGTTSVVTMSDAARVAGVRTKSQAQSGDLGSGIGDVGQIGDTFVLFPVDRPLSFVATSRDRLAELVEQPDPYVRRQLEQLRRQSYRNRDATLIVAPSFLLADGRTLLSGTLAPIRRQLVKFLGDGTQAMSFSVDVGTSLYSEVRWVTQAEKNPFSVAQDRRLQLLSFSRLVSRHLESVRVDEYWQPLAERLPAMLDFAVRNTRIGVVDGCAVMNVAMPPAAAPNLMLGFELALANARMSRPVAAQTSSTRNAHGNLAATVSVLNQVINFSVDQQSIEKTLDELAQVVRQQTDAADFGIHIAGQHLQLEGITRNQQIQKVSMQGRRIREVLTELVVRGNPLRAKDPTSHDQKLVWVVQVKDDQDSQQTPLILVTTRTAAMQNGYELPSEFVAE